jgi:hypothetical protein
VPIVSAWLHPKGLEIMLERMRTLVSKRKIGTYEIGTYEIGTHTELEHITNEITGVHNFQPKRGLPLPAAYCLIVDLEMNQFTALDEDGTETFTADIDPILAKAPQRELATT